MTAQPIVALELGATRVTCAIGLPHERAPGLELMGTSIVPYPSLPDGWLGDPLLVGRTIEQALEATAVNVEFDRALVAISHPALAGERVTASIALGDEPVTIASRDLGRLRNQALAQALSVDREALLVECLGCRGNGFDGIRDPRGLSATRLIGAYHVVTLPVAARRAVVQAVESAGLEVARLTYALPLGLWSLEDEALRHQQVLILDVGGLHVDVGLFTDGALTRLAVVPWGGVSAAKRVASELQTTMEQALTWTSEGLSCRKPEVRDLLQKEWGAIGQAVRAVLDGEPQPDAVLLCGRGCLIDGFAEWVEQTTGRTAAFARSARTNRVGDVARQLALTTAIGLLEQATQDADSAAIRPAHALERLIGRTRTILTEYF